MCAQQSKGEGELRRVKVFSFVLSPLRLNVCAQVSEGERKVFSPSCVHSRVHERKWKRKLACNGDLSRERERGRGEWRNKMKRGCEREIVRGSGAREGGAEEGVALFVPRKLFLLCERGWRERE